MKFRVQPIGRDIMMNGGFPQLFERHEREDYNAAESEAAIRRMIVDEFEEADRILSAGLDKNALKTLDAEGQPFVPTRKSDKFHMRKHTACQQPYYHGHSFFEFIYVLSGECVQHFKSPESELTLKKGQACLLPPSTVHSLEKSRKGDNIIKTVIPTELFEKCAEGLDFGGKVIVFERTSEQVNFIVMRLLGEYYGNAEYSERAVEKYLSLLFIELLRGTDDSDERLAYALEHYFSENIGSASLKEFASTLGYSEKYAGRMIKERIGSSFSELLLSYKLKKAARLIADTELSIVDIAHEAGYDNPSGLYKQFFAFYGMTPSAYRKMAE